MSVYAKDPLAVIPENGSLADYINRWRNGTPPAGVMHSDKILLSSPFDECMLIKEECLRFGETVHLGNFCEIRMGCLQSKSEKEVNVVIKSPKKLCDSSKARFLDDRYIKEFMDFLNELKYWQGIGENPGIIKYYGAIFSKDSLYEGEAFYVLEYCEIGKLLHFLRSYAQNSGIIHDDIQGWCRFVSLGVNTRNNEKLLCTKLEVSVLIKWCLGIASVDKETCITGADNFIPKLGNFSPAIPALPNDWQFSSPEVLSSSDYSDKSDIWSFGVTVWQMFTLGRTPYDLHTANTIEQYLAGGNILEMPIALPEELWSTIKSCWTLTTNCRPSFGLLVKRFQEYFDTIDRIVCTCDFYSLGYVSLSDAFDDPVELERKACKHTYRTLMYQKKAPESSCESDIISDGSAAGKLSLELEIASGNFGLVRFGKMFSSEKMDCIPVAVKSVNHLDTDSKEAKIQNLAAFMNEVHLTKRLGKHPNVVQYIDFFATDEMKKQYNACLILEYCMAGDVKTYLKNFFIRGGTVHDDVHGNCGFAEDLRNSQRKRLPQYHAEPLEGIQLNMSTLVKWCCDIASGMEYITYRGIIHRDLAARNILLGCQGPPVSSLKPDMLVPKISDFGLSRSLILESTCNQQDVLLKKYYSVLTNKLNQAARSKQLFPVLWICPEALESLKFTPKNDSWSYGVTLWEIFTFGETPYTSIDGLNFREVRHSGEAKAAVSRLLKFLKLGQTLVVPTSTPDKIRSITKRCWDLNPDKRPGFATLKQEFETYLDNLERVQCSCLQNQPSASLQATAAKSRSREEKVNLDSDENEYHDHLKADSLRDGYIGVEDLKNLF